MLVKDPVDLSWLIAQEERCLGNVRVHLAILRSWRTQIRPRHHSFHWTEIVFWQDQADRYAALREKIMRGALAKGVGYRN